MTAAFTVRVQDDVARKLDKIAALSDRSRAYLAAQAIEDYVVREEWQLAEIQARIAEADRQEFATSEELGSVIAKYVGDGRRA
ncbi:CopG family ribbon-helix-helix protein [Ochrobactrum sp. MYb379]|uniref:CopG family ribbon-helix-helix protein n=1 Tax=Ochrobactrum sp. MYb379 TaxID=2745275 RepID=UPI00309FA394